MQSQTTTLTDNLEIFRRDFLNANTWAQRKDGVPLYLIDKLTPEDLLTNSSKNMKLIIAHSIFQICQDSKMIDIALEETPEITNPTNLIDILYLLPDFNDERVNAMLNNFRDHQEYLVAYNAARALGLSTDEVVEKFRSTSSSTERNLPKAKIKWWQKIFGAG
ncbi:MAG: hypothetical protein IPG02_12885 [Ignavibacteria bacterium]|nr:hypothetical protein [Ignavibacteria bacterium]